MIQALIVRSFTPFRMTVRRLGSSVAALYLSRCSPWRKRMSVAFIYLPAALHVTSVISIGGRDYDLGAVAKRASVSGGRESNLTTSLPLVALVLANRSIGNAGEVRAISAVTARRYRIVSQARSKAPSYLGVDFPLRFSRPLALLDQLPKLAPLAQLRVFRGRQFAAKKKIAQRILVQHPVDCNSFLRLLEVNPVIFRTKTI